MRWFLTLMFALAIGVGALYGLTDGFTVVTAEAARRQEVAQNPRAIHDAQLVSDQDSLFFLRNELQADGRIAIVNFFYTRCISLCLAQGFVTQRLQEAIEADGLQSRVRLISISFDPRDHGRDLSRYATSMNANPAVWQFWAFEQPRQRNVLLRQFGITVIPAELGDFQHNAALHVVTPDGRLASIIDIDDAGRAFQLAKSLSTDLSMERSTGLSAVNAAGRLGSLQALPGYAYTTALGNRGKQ